MRLATFVVLLGGYLVTCTSLEGDQSETVRAIIESVSSEYTPDHRTALFDVRWDAGHNLLRGETNVPAAKRQLLDDLADQQVVAIDSIEVLAARLALVNISVCNIRSEPRHGAELSTQSLLGTPLKVYKEVSGWFLVQTPDMYMGWLDGGGMTLISDQDYLRWKEATRVVVREPLDFVRRRGDEDVVADVVAGNILEVQEVVDQDFFVILPDGRKGRISKRAVVPYQAFVGSDESRLSSILETAQHFMGRPYLWGGTSPLAVDCSGFTKTVFYLNGLELPRDASQQVRVGQAVETDSTLRNLEVGDFLFFGQRATETNAERITHVAIYLGEGNIIHAAGRVQIESLRRGDGAFNAYRLKTLVRARRMLPGIGSNGVRWLHEHPWY